MSYVRVLIALLPQCCFSRNQLSHIPPVLCRLRHLEVLLATNNKLVSLPEEIGELEHLMELVRAATCWPCLH